jgi:amphi-Trp domain-containing protein
MENVDVECIYPKREIAAKLRRIAKAIESGSSFRIQVNGNRVRVPSGARIDIEVERDHHEGGEVEIEIKWDRTRYGN